MAFERSEDIFEKISIRTVLQDFNIHIPQTQKNHYMVSLRDEKQPSCSINEGKNVWYDFGTNEKGGVLDLVIHLHELNKGIRLSKSEAINYLRNLADTPVNTSNIHQSKAVSKKKEEPVLDINSVQLGLHMNMLKDYIVNQRHIPLNIADRYLFTVSLNMPSGKPIYYVGFPTSAGQWQLRNATKYGKRATGSYPTIISYKGDEYNGQYAQGDVEKIEPTHNRVVVFEGFCNFLSMLTYLDSEYVNADVVVLNSAHHTEKIIEFARKHDEVVLLYDNDKTGDKYTELLYDALSSDGIDRSIEDARNIYEGYDDFNDFICALAQNQVSEQQLDAQQDKSTRVTQKH